MHVGHVELHTLGTRSLGVARSRMTSPRSRASASLMVVLNKDPITPRVIGAAIKVHAALGPGLLEKAYERCLAHRLQTEGLTVRTQVPVPIEFEGLVIPAAYRIDLLVNSTVLVEIKSVERLHETHLAQVVTYLKLSRLKYGLLLNFNSVRLSDGMKRVLNGSS